MQCDQSSDLLQSWQKPVPLGFYSTQYETIQFYGLANFLVGISGSRNYRMQFGNMIYYNVSYSCNVCSEVSSQSYTDTLPECLVIIMKEMHAIFKLSSLAWVQNKKL